MRYQNVNEQTTQGALASTRMEGLPVTADIERNVRRILSGEIVVEQRVQEIREKRHKKQVWYGIQYGPADCRALYRNYIVGGIKMLDFSKANEWKIIETDFAPAALGKVETNFCLGNGYLGLRSATGEKYLNPVLR